MIDAGSIDAEIDAVCDVVPDRAAGFAKACGARAFESLEEVVERCDALWVCTPTAAHSDAVRLAAQAGRAVFCEKPLATDLPGAISLLQVVEEAGVPAQVGLVLRSTPVFRVLRDLTASERLGSPMAAVFRDDQYFPVQGVYGSTWRADSKLAGGGCLIEHSIHDLDILRFCLGEVAELSCTTSNMSHTGDVEDVATVTMRFSSGASASLVSIWHSITNRGSTRRLELFFERGMAWLEDDFLGPIHVYSTEGEEVIGCSSPKWVTDLPLSNDAVGLAIRMYVEADRAFVEAVARGKCPTPGFEQAVLAHRLVDAAYDSASSGGTPVEIDPTDPSA